MTLRAFFRRLLLCQGVPMRHAAWAALMGVPVLVAGPALAQTSLGEDSFATTARSGSDTEASQSDGRLRRLARPGEPLVTGSLNDADVLTTAAQPQIAPAQGGTDDTGDAFAATGIQRGPLTWFPAIDLAIGYDSNIDSTRTSREVTTFRIAPQLRLETDWRRHAFVGALRGSLLYVDDGRDLEHTLGADGALRLDVDALTTVTLRGGYELTGEAVGDANAVAGASGTTDTHEFVAAIGVERTLGWAAIGLEAEASRSLFGDTPLAGGVVQTNDDRDRTDASLTLRLQRAEGPLLRPFVEAEARMRRFDQDRDRNGFERASTGYALRGGVGFANDGPLSGEVSVGVVGERFEDDRLEDVDALSAAASLTWDVTQLTSVTLDVDTQLDPTTRAGSGVAIERSAALGLSHALRRNVELRLRADVEDTQFSGTDAETRTYGAGAGVTWQLSPVVAVRVDTRYEHEPDAAGDIDRFTAEAGITLRR